MNAQLIIDFSDRTFGALIVTPDGQLLTCSQEINHVVTRYLSSEILFDPRPSEDPDFAWDEAAEALAPAKAHNLFQRTRRLGLRRPWDLPIPIEALRLPSPLAVLSSPAALLDPVVRTALPVVGIALLEALLDPIFNFLADRQLLASKTDAFVVVPAYTNRAARLALHKVFRRRRFRPLTFVSREVAAAMALLPEAPIDCTIWDATSDDLHLIRVAVEREGDVGRIRTVAARTIRGLGWTYWVQEIVTCLVAEGRALGRSAALVSAVDRALMGLLTGSQDSLHLPTALPLRLSHGLIEEIFDSKRRDELSGELRSRLEPHISALGAVGLPTILLGAICGVEAIQSLFLPLTGGQPLAVVDKPLLERTSRGVATGRLWLREDQTRRIETPPSGSLRLNTFRGEAVEVLTAAQLPGPGEHCYLRQRFRFAGDFDSSTPFLVHLLWGSDTAPEGNAHLCTFPVDVVSGSGSELSVTVQLRRSASGRRLDGTVEASAHHASPEPRPARSSFVQDLTAFPSASAGEESAR